MAQVFEGLRVADLSQGMAGPMAAMVLADNGADVVKVEPPTGDWARRLPGFLMWNRGKRSVVLDLEDASDAERAHRLIDRCDVVVTTFRPGQGEGLGFGDAALRAQNPGLVHLAISGFGLAQGFDNMRAYEGVVSARSGRVNGNDNLSGTANPDAANRPIYLASPNGSYGAALLGVEGVAAALFARMRTGRGQKVETSVLDGMGATTMRLRFQRDGDAVIPAHVSHGRSVMLRGIKLCFLTAECGDGRYIQMCARQDHHFRNWMTALGFTDVMADERFAHAPMGFTREEDVDELEAMVRKRMLEKTQAEWMKIFIEDYDVGADPFLTADEYLAHPQMVTNGRIADLADPSVGRVTQVGALANFACTPSRIERSAPQLGEHQSLVVGGCWDDEATEPTQASANGDAAPDPRAPFAGVTVLEIAYFLAAPLGPTLVSELGARVIKVEPLTGDPYRRVGLESIHIVAGKESIAVDLKTPEGREILYRLVERADAVVHNFRPGVPDRLGMDYESLRSVKPDLVYHYAGSYGSAGPQSHRAAFHSMPNALTGGGVVQAGRGNAPVDDSYPDPCAGIGVGAALAMALFARGRLGSGQQLETTMLASNGYVHSNDLVRYPGAPERLLADNGQHGLHALYRLYRTSDGWVFVAVVQDKEWVRFAGAVGRPEWPSDPRYATHEDRLGNDEDLEAECVRMFATAPSADWERRLGEAGVPIAVVPEQNFEEFLAGEGLLRPESHGAFGEYWRLPPKVRLSESASLLKPACAVGEHTHAILEELGYSTEERTALEARGVVLQLDLSRGRAAVEVS